MASVGVGRRQGAVGVQDWFAVGGKHGRTHNDTKRFKAHPFQHQPSGQEWTWLSHPELRTVAFLHDDTWVYGLQCSWSYGDNRVIKGQKNISPRPHVPQQRRIVSKELTLEDGEFIVHVEVWCGEWVDAVSVKTSSGREMKWGGSGGVHHVLAIPHGERLLGLHGGYGGHLHSLGLVTYRTPLASTLVAKMTRLRREAAVLRARGWLGEGAEAMPEALKVACDHIVETFLPAFWRQRYHTALAAQEEQEQQSMLID